mmetsp:Transcript_49208/g.158850  ORF Transcript_49208/g.158850 Transcript_49208/m.158850 type:complete len:279 (+) Transcript_49208:29-865(+)
MGSGPLGLYLPGAVFGPHNLPPLCRRHGLSIARKSSPPISASSSRASSCGARHSLLLLLLELPLVEGKLLALQDVAVAAAGLPGARGDGREEAAGLELLLNSRIHLVLRLASLELENHMAALLLDDLLSLVLLASSLLALFGQIDPVLFEIPLLERLRIDLHDGVLREGLGTHQLVARRVVDDVEETHLLGAVLRTPGEVAGIDAETPVLHVATTASNSAHTLGTELAECGRAAHLILALLLVDVPAATGGAVLVAGGARDSHGCGGWESEGLLMSCC